ALRDHIVVEVGVVVAPDLLRRDVDALADLAVHELRALDLGLDPRAVHLEGQALGRQRALERRFVHAVPLADLANVPVDVVVAGGDAEGLDLALEKLVGDERLQDRPRGLLLGVTIARVALHLERRDRLSVHRGDDAICGLRADRRGTGDGEPYGRRAAGAA